VLLRLPEGFPPQLLQPGSTWTNEQPDPQWKPPSLGDGASAGEPLPNRRVGQQRLAEHRSIRLVISEQLAQLLEVDQLGGSRAAVEPIRIRVVEAEIDRPGLSIITMQADLELDMPS
jgi:hypothetical protein